MRIVGHGIDLVPVARIAAMLAEHGDRFLDRCFTPGERAHGEGGRRYHEHLAARFAAKEAALKALGTGLTSSLAWTDIEVVSLPSGQPQLRLRGPAVIAASSRGINEWFVSLSHTDDHAIASVIAVQISRRTD